MSAPDGVPQEFLAANPNATWQEAVPLPPMDITEPHLVSASLPPEQLEELWRPIRERQAEMMARIKSLPERAPRERAPRPLVIGITGTAGSGKSLAASMIPGAAMLQLADPLYAALAAMFNVPESLLRSQHVKAAPLPQALFASPRKLLQTLGTEWGRRLISDQIWIMQASTRIAALRDAGVSVIAIADVRFENEARWIRDELRGAVWHVRRDSVSIDGHESEAGVAVDPRDTVLLNGSTVADLREQVVLAFQQASRNTLEWGGEDTHDPADR